MICKHKLMCIYMYVHVCICTLVCIGMHVYMCMYMHRYVYACVFVYMCLSVCLCIWVPICHSGNFRHPFMVGIWALEGGISLLQSPYWLGCTGVLYRPVGSTEWDQQLSSTRCQSELSLFCIFPCKIPEGDLRAYKWVWTSPWSTPKSLSFLGTT